MNYFLELLESYSKLKKRKLNLLAEKEIPKTDKSQEVVANKIKQEKYNLAKQALNSALSQIDNTDPQNPQYPTNQKPYIVTTPRGEQVAIFYNQTGSVGWKFSKVTADGKGDPRKAEAAGGYRPGDTTPQPRFIAKFSTVESGGKKNKEKESEESNADKTIDPSAPQSPGIQLDPESIAGAQIAEYFNSLLAQAASSVGSDPNALQDILIQGQEAYQNMVDAGKNFDAAKDYLMSWHKQEGETKKSDTTAKLLKGLRAASNYIFGSRLFSVESKITKTTYKLTGTTRDGIFTAVNKGSISGEDLLAFTKIMKEFFEVFKPDGTKIKDKINANLRFFREKFTLNSDYTVTIHLGEKTDKDKSLVISEYEHGDVGRGLFRLMLESIQRNFEKDANGNGPQLDKVNILKKASTGFNNQVRGTLLEKMLIYNTLVNNYNDSLRRNDGSAARWKKLIDSNIKADVKFKRNLQSLKDLHEEWNAAGEFAALPEEDHYLNTALSQFFDEQTSLLFKAAYVISSDVNRKKPFTMIHAGLETGPGLKADALEVYLTPVEGSSEELASEVAELKQYIDEGLIAPDAVVHMKRPDYKHYIDYGKNTEFNAGGSSRNSINEMIRGIKEIAEKVIKRPDGSVVKRKAQDRSKLIQYNNSILIDGTNALAPLTAFLDEVEKDIESVGSLSVSNINVETGGKRDYGQTLAKAMSDIIRQKFLHSDTEKANSSIARIKSLADEYSSSQTIEERKEILPKLKNLVKSTLTSLNIHKKISSNDPSDVKVGKNMLISILNSAAGSVQRGAYSINRVMGPQSTREYQFERNKPLSFFQTFIKNAKEKNIVMKGSDFYLIDDDGTVLGTIVHDAKKDNFSLYYDETFLSKRLGIQPRVVEYKQFRKRGEEIPRENTVLNAFIESQKKLLETLILMQKESVGKDKKIRQL